MPTSINLQFPFSPSGDTLFKEKHGAKKEADWLRRSEEVAKPNYISFFPFRGIRFSKKSMGPKQEADWLRRSEEVAKPNYISFSPSGETLFKEKHGAKKEADWLRRSEEWPN